MSRKLLRVPGTVQPSLAEGGAALRTLGMGLVAAAAIAASVMIGRTRQDRPEPNEPGVAPAGDAAPPLPSLDAIRAAGL